MKRLIVTPETRKAWDSRVIVEWEGGPLKVVSPQGLILLKSFRRSGQDKDDIEYLRSISSEDWYEFLCDYNTVEDGGSAETYLSFSCWFQRKKKNTKTIFSQQVGATHVKGPRPLILSFATEDIERAEGIR